MRLTVEEGCFSYRPGTPVLNRVSFSAGPGELVAILGPNGAGKTTLLRATMGLLRWQSGKSCLDGQDIRTIPARTLWQKVAYVPQAKRATAGYTVEEMVLLGRTSRLGIFATPSRKDRQVTKEVLERLHIIPLADKRCDQLSGGELQMVLIARALAAQPEILILDEPESNLDFRNQLIVLDTLSALAAEGMACVFNTHYPAHALQRADKALLLQKDGTSCFGPTAGMVTEETMERAFGVRTAICEVQSRGTVLKDVLPISLTQREGEDPAS